MHKKVIDYYQDQLSIAIKKKEDIDSLIRRISLIRLFLFLISILCMVIFYDSRYILLIFIAIVISFGAVLIYNSIIINKNKNNISTIKLFKSELKSDQSSEDLYENGLTFMDKSHNYANDLDIFGSNSIFHYINRCFSHYGCKCLASWLLNSSSSKEITERQVAVNELSKKELFRVKIGIIGILNKNKKNFECVGNTKLVQLLKNLRTLTIVFSIINIALMTLSIVNVSLLPVFMFFLIFTYFYIYSFKWNKIKHIFDNISKTDKSLKYYSCFIEAIEKEDFTSPLLKRLKYELQINNKTGISTLKSLQRSIKWIDYRLDFVYQMSINTLFYTDILLLYRVEKWKLLYGAQLNNWQRTIGQLEALNSFAILHFNNPDWCFPSIKDNFQIKIVDAGHPLIEQRKRVTNNYYLDSFSNVDILTGSNMSGKSTFLRCIGVNVLLALAGSPVCAKEMSVSPLKLMTYMRIEDNLQDNTSTFYAEIKRIKRIFEECKNNSNVFLLLDELLRGTNNIDKTEGSIAIIENIINTSASAIIATHDLSITDLCEKNNIQIRKYYFDIIINEYKMYFDYKLKEGVCKTRNASLLLKEIGIEIKS